MTEPRARPERASSATSPPGAPPPDGLVEDGAGAAALDRVLREPDYRARLSAETVELFRLELLFRRGLKGEVSRRFCRRLAAVAERVEYGLLEVGARGNRTYAHFAEVVTGVRWTSKAIHALLHLRGRIRRYLPERSDLGGFRRELDGCVRWLGGRLSACIAAAREEAEGSLGLVLPREPFEAGLLGTEDERWRLPQDVDVQEAVDERQTIAEVATEFLGLAAEMQALGVPETDDPAALAEFVARRFPLAAAHEARVRMHGVQSTYDATVAATPIEAGDAQLKVFRGYVSILLHLLEAVAYLLQIHQRFDLDARSAKIRDRTARLVDPAELLRWSVRFGVANTAACFREAISTARAVLERYTRTRDAVLDLPPGKKLHLRPAGLIVRVVQHHGLPVRMRMGDEDVDARELMDVILLAASHPTATKVAFRGDERPLADLQELFKHRLGEEGLEALPPSLAYLLTPPPKAAP